MGVITVNVFVVCSDLHVDIIRLLFLFVRYFIRVQCVCCLAHIIIHFENQLESVSSTQFIICSPYYPFIS